MGYAALSNDVKSVLQEVARMAYGTGPFQGRRGGKDRMGLLTAKDGSARVVKFNVRGGERPEGLAVGEQPAMLASSNKLRKLLLDIGVSAGLDETSLAEIRAKLGLSANAARSDEPLNQKDVARVVTLIGGDEVWNDALARHGGIGQKIDAQRFARILEEVRREEIDSIEDEVLGRNVSEVVKKAFDGPFLTFLTGGSFLTAMTPTEVKVALKTVFREMRNRVEWGERFLETPQHKKTSYLQNRLLQLLKNDRRRCRSLLKREIRGE